MILSLWLFLYHSVSTTATPSLFNFHALASLIEAHAFKNPIKTTTIHWIFCRRKFHLLWGFIISATTLSLSRSARRHHRLNEYVNVMNMIIWVPWKMCKHDVLDLLYRNEIDALVYLCILWSEHTPDTSNHFSLWRKIEKCVIFAQSGAKLPEKFAAYCSLGSQDMLTGKIEPKTISTK